MSCGAVAMAKMYAGSNAALTMGYIIAAHLVGPEECVQAHCLPLDSLQGLFSSVSFKSRAWCSALGACFELSSHYCASAVLQAGPGRDMFRQ